MSKTFAYHKPSEKGLERLKKLRAKLSELEELLKGETQPSREQSVALTQLETAGMWIIKAAVVNDPESKVEE